MRTVSEERTSGGFMSKKTQYLIISILAAILTLFTFAYQLFPLAEEIPYTQFLSLVDTQSISKVTIKNGYIYAVDTNSNTTYKTGYVAEDNLIDKLYALNIPTEKYSEKAYSGTVISVFLAGCTIFAVLSYMSEKNHLSGESVSSDNYLIDYKKNVNNRFLGNPEIATALSNMLQEMENKNIPHQICIITNKSQEETYRTFIEVCSKFKQNHYYINSSLDNLSEIIKLTDNDPNSIIYIEGDSLTANTISSLMNPYTKATLVISVSSPLPFNLLSNIHPTITIHSSLPLKPQRYKSLSSYLEKLNHSEDIDIDTLSQYTRGYSHLDLYNLLRCALSNARLNGRQQVIPDDLDYVYLNFNKTNIGISEEAFTAIATRFAGQLTIALALGIPTTETIPVNNDSIVCAYPNSFLKKNEFNKILIMIAGHSAEEIYDIVSTQSEKEMRIAAENIQKAIISELNLVPPLSDSVLSQINQKTTAALKNIENQVKNFLSSNQTVVDSIIEEASASECISSQLLCEFKAKIDCKEILPTSIPIDTALEISPIYISPQPQQNQSNTETAQQAEKNKSNKRRSKTDIAAVQEPVPTPAPKKSSPKKKSETIESPTISDEPLEEIPTPQDEDAVLFEDQSLDFFDGTDMPEEIPAQEIEIPEPAIDIEPESVPVEHPEPSRKHDTVKTDQKKEIENLLKLANQASSKKKNTK